MITHKAGKRYAQALFDLAREKDCMDQAYHDTQSLTRLLKQSAELKLFMANPEIPTKKRLAIFEKIFKKHIHPFTYTFLCFLDKKDRLNLTNEICEGFETLYLRHKKILKIRITGARDMDKGHIQAISERLKTRFQEDIQATVTVDSSLIAGFKVQVKDLIYDLSIASQLEKFKNRVIENF